MLPDENGARRIPSMAIALTLVLAAGACEERPAPDQCRAMADHIVELERAHYQGRAATLAGDVAQERHEALQTTCLEAGTLQEVRCVLETESLDALPRCNPR